MDFRPTAAALGLLLLLLAVCEGATGLAGLLLLGDPAARALLLGALLTAAAGGLLLLLARPGEGMELSPREGFAVATLGWLTAGFFGALPYFLSGWIPRLVDALFESLSGFTTTGATILQDVEAFPRALHLWRALTQWLGGMGILVLAVAVLPLLGVGGMQLFRAEVPGPTKERLLPRIQDTAKLLWGVYALLTLAACLTYHLAGMPLFDAVCHSFTSLATGGFSTRAESLGAFGPAVQWAAVVFMFLAGVNFALHAQAVRRRPRYWRSEECLLYAGLVLGAATVVVTLNALDSAGPFERTLRNGAFQVVSILTTTGYATTDFELWPVASQLLLLFLMVIGGSSGSTAGGVKVLRVLLAVKHAHVELYRLVHPQTIRYARVDGQVASGDVLRSALGLCVLHAAVTAVAVLCLAALRLDFITATAAVFACLNNVGPGLGEVGPADHYAYLPDAAKILLSLCMVIGRLEFYTVLVLLLPSFWRR